MWRVSGASTPGQGMAHGVALLPQGGDEDNPEADDLWRPRAGGETKTTERKIEAGRPSEDLLPEWVTLAYMCTCNTFFSGQIEKLGILNELISVQRHDDPGNYTLQSAEKVLSFLCFRNKLAWSIEIQHHFNRWLAIVSDMLPITSYVPWPLLAAITYSQGGRKKSTSWTCWKFPSSSRPPRWVLWETPSLDGFICEHPTYAADTESIGLKLGNW